MPVTAEVRVRYAETDQMNVVYYANYYVWFEIGRVEVLRSLGLSYRQLEKDHNLGLPVIELSKRLPPGHAAEFDRIHPPAYVYGWYAGEILKSLTHYGLLPVR